MEIEKKLYSEIKDYCSINNLKIGDFINKLLRKAFNVEKYGAVPPFLKDNSMEKTENNKPIQTEAPIETNEYIEKDKDNIKENLKNNLDNRAENSVDLRPRNRRKLS